MRHFVCKFVCGILLLAGLYGILLFVLLQKEKQKYKQAISLSEKSVICFSDSQTVYGLNPAAWPELVNLSSEAAPLDVQLMKLRDILGQNPGKISLVLIDVSFLRYANGKKCPVLTPDSVDVKFFPLYLWHNGESKLYATCPELWHSALNWTRYRLRSLMTHDNTCILAQGFLERNGSQILSKRTKQEEEGRQYAQWCNEAMPLSHDAWSRKVIAEMFENCQKHQIQSCLLHMPLHSFVLQHLKPEILHVFQEEQQGLAQAYGARFISLWGLPLEDSDYIDINHLNASGAYIAAGWLKQQLQCSSLSPQCQINNPRP